jgi:peptidoglycan biosynthesis protein MviN/MurJ (putative lipid II flippase)
VALTASPAGSQVQGTAVTFTATASCSSGTPIYRVVAASLLITAWMMAAALPIIDLVYRRGRFNFEDSRQTAAFFFWFSVSLAFWAAQGLYARAFYAAGNTLTPMISGTLVTLASLPVYGWLFHTFGVVGLAIASDLGIATHTVVLALLLHRNGLLPGGSMPWQQLAKALATALVPELGYEAASELVERAQQAGRSVREHVLAEGILSGDQLDELLSAESVLRLGTPQLQRRGHHD